MNTATHTANPILADLSTEALLEDLKARGVVVSVKEPKAPKAPKPVKTANEIMLDALALIVTISEDGKIVAIEDDKLSEDGKVMKEAIAEKTRTTTASIEKSKRPAYTGKPRGPKKADAPAGDAPTDPETPATDAAPEAPAPENTTEA